MPRTTSMLSRWAWLLGLAGCGSAPTPDAQTPKLAPDASSVEPVSKPETGAEEPAPMVELTEPTPLALPRGPASEPVPATGLAVWAGMDGVWVGDVASPGTASALARLSGGVAARNDAPDLGDVHGYASGWVHEFQNEHGDDAFPPTVVFADRRMPSETMAFVLTQLGYADLRELVLATAAPEGARGVAVQLERFETLPHRGPLPTDHAADYEIVSHDGGAVSIYAWGRPATSPPGTALWGGPARRLADPDGACVLPRPRAKAVLRKMIEASCKTPAAIRVKLPADVTWADVLEVLPDTSPCAAHVRFEFPFRQGQPFYEEKRFLPAPTDADCSTAVAPEALLGALNEDGRRLATEPAEKHWAAVRALDASSVATAKRKAGKGGIMRLGLDAPSSILFRFIFLQSTDIDACLAQHRKTKEDHVVQVDLDIDAAGKAKLRRPEGSEFERCLEPRVAHWWFPPLAGAPTWVSFQTY